MYAIIRARVLRRARERRARLERRILRFTSNPLEMEEELFVKKFRLSRELFVDLVEIIRGELAPSQRSTAIPLELKLLSCLSFLATGSYQTPVGADRYLMLSQPSVSRHQAAIIDVLNKIMGRFIKFPATPQERAEVKLEFYRKFGMPGVIGCIDGTLVAIALAPAEHEEVYISRKGYHAINAAIICDSNLKIIGVSARFGGRAHDSYVWQSMQLSQYVEHLHVNGESGWLLGDSGYPQRPWLMTPILNAQPGTPEAHYTHVHVHTRVTVEQCIGVLKGRWRCLLKARALHYHPQICAKIINACAVLHNLCIGRNVPVELVPDIVDRDAPAVNVAHNDFRGRQALIDQLWLNR